MEVNIHQAKTHLSSLLRRVAAGEEVVITRAGRPVAKLVTASRLGGKRPLGMDKGKIWIADDFNAALPHKLLKAFYGGDLPKLELRGRK